MIRLPPVPRLVPGTLVVAFLLATGRWGSYLGWPDQSIYLTDIFLLVGLVSLIWRGTLFQPPDRRDVRALLPAVALLGWSVVRLIGNLELNSSVVRDAAPYGYLLLAVAAAIRVEEGAWARSLTVLRAALVFHMVWVTVSRYVPRVSVDSPLLGGRVHVLEIRADFDGAMLAVLATMAAHQCIVATRWWRRLVWLPCVAWPAFLILQLGSRGGLIALVAALAVLAGANVRRLLRVPRLAVVAAGLVCVLAGVVFVPHTSVYRRLTGDPAFHNNSAGGTASARLTAWTDVVDYLNGSALAVVGGVGFGPDFLVDSGAAVNLEGTTYQDVRAPHNYLLNTYARTGLVGLVLLLGLLGAWLRAVYRRCFAGFVYSEQDLLCAVLGVTLLVTSLVGVILESPFGAVPFFWAVGRLLVSSGPRVPVGTAIAALPLGQELRRVPALRRPAPAGRFGHRP